MKEFQTIFIEKIERTKSVSSFRFKCEERISFVPGQFLQVVFDAVDKGNRQLNKYLSFSCAPDKTYIEVTKRITASDFSKRLLSLTSGDPVLLKGPMGNCVLEGDSAKYAFLIGGIGITPVISILEDIVLRKASIDARLLYSNLAEDDMPFQQELDLWEKILSDMHVCYTVVSSTPEKKEYIFGMITRDLVLTKIPDYKDRLFYIFGPPAMVEAMKGICKGIGCDMAKVKAEKIRLRIRDRENQLEEGT